MEDYAIFHIFSTEPALDLSQFVDLHGASLSQILRCEDQTLSDQEIRDATSTQIVFGTQDLTLIDWNAALMIGQEMDDVLAVLEFVNVELVERRLLDHQLDEALDEMKRIVRSHRKTGIGYAGREHRIRIFVESQNRRALYG